jgi:cyclopropane fatty-acyl-phospholipid synthase-like methyltransferase
MDETEEAKRPTLSSAQIAAERGPFAGTQCHLDAPYRETPPDIVERMLDLAQVGAGCRLIDLGCGDGRIVIAAALRGATAQGIDLDPARVTEAQQAAKAAGVAERVRFAQGDMFAADLSEAEVVTLFLLSHVNRWLEGKLQRELPLGARVVSHQFGMPNWQPAATDRIGKAMLYLWRQGDGLTLAADRT